VSSEPATGDSSVETGVVTVDGTTLAYRTAGCGHPLVFLHAGIADSRLWDRQLERFADDYRVVAYDLRGYGESSLPDEPYAHHRDLGRVLDSLGVEAAHLVGASMGGAVAVDFALTAPERITSLTLVAPALGGYRFTDDATHEGWEAAGAAFEAGDFGRAATIESDLWLAGPDRTLDDVDEDVRALVRSMLLQSYEHQHHEPPETSLDPPAIHRLADLRVPVLLVSGALDRPDMDAIAARIEADAPSVKREVVDDAAHLPSLERPSAFDRLLHDFLDGVSAQNGRKRVEK
jgi:3-oxoadipate enol-lactonase